MKTCDRSDVNISENSTGKNHNTPGSTVAGHEKFCFRKPLMVLLMVFLSLLPLSSSVAGNLTCRQLPILMDNYLNNHYAMRTLTGEIKAHAVDQMIKGLDPSKTLLYESDVKMVTPILENLFTSLEAGNCTSLKQVYDVLVARSRENETIVKNILGQGFRIDKTLTLTIDVDKRPYVKSPAEKKDLLRKIVQFQIENALLAGINLEEAKKQQIHRYKLNTMRVIERNPEKLVTNVAESFAEALDPHTSYLSPENFDDFRIQMQLFLEGIGAVLKSDNGFTVIEELIPGGSAERSGLLKPKDKIIAVTQKKGKPVNVIDMDLREVVKLIRGKKGTQVTLTILRQEERTSRFNITLTRDKVDIKEQEAKISYEERTMDGRKYRIGVIDLPSFYGDDKGNKSSYADVKKLIRDAKLKHVDGLVLDLSRNGGGLLTEAVRIAGLFIGDGGIVATKDRDGEIKILFNGSTASEVKDDNIEIISFPAENPDALYSGPLVVLTSRLSASASEIVAGALKDYHRAVIVGADHTFGKGSVQTLVALPMELGGMKITMSMYFLPGGKSTQKTGVLADIKLPMFFVLEEVGETELEYPLPGQSISPFLDLKVKSAPLWKPVEQTTIFNLAGRSQTRVTKDAKFAEILKNNKEAASRKGIIRLADLRKELEKENGGKKEKNVSSKQKAREMYLPFVNESVNVLLDMIKPGTKL